MPRDLNDTLIFAKVVEHGSFISAARALRLPKTTVSRKIQELELRLGAQLLHRTTRKLGLTEAGNIYFEHSQRIARELDEAESAIGQLQGGPRGWLRVTAPYSFAISRITPLFGEFQARYPEVRVEMVLTNEPLDLIDKEIDVALRVGPLRDGNLVARRLSVFRSQVYASPRYLERHGEPVHPGDLQHHRTLGMNKFGMSGHGYFWPLNDGSTTTDFRINPVLVANDPAALQPALLTGEGLMLTADVMVKAYAEHGYVQRVLAGWTGPTAELNAVFPRGQGKSPKVRAFVDFLIERVKFDADYMEELCPNHQCCEAELEIAAATAAASIGSTAPALPAVVAEA
ncbi:MAG TPA: LysR substrate-binding domain-containing protein [Steroidobacteraceae bacterium]|jgi:DNA-binding transcriptional LysR family regulator|nr:LysR substrate-binding domain-containing protein [Steroidobacteraceae bacterium]